MKLQPLRDALYNYVYLTSIERKIVDTQQFQRLRFIAQNSSAYLTYPSNQLNRFTHSLGVMHLGGKMFIQSLENSDLKHFVCFMEHGKECIKDEISKNPNNFDIKKPYKIVEKQWSENFGNLSGFSIQSHHIDSDKRFGLYKDYLFIINTFWSALRIACMLHDIGHFPYSHLFETAILESERIDNSVGKSFQDKKDSFINSLKSKYGKYAGFSVPKMQPHEIMGAEIISDFVEKIVKEDSESFFERLVLSLGIRVFFNVKDKKKYSIIECLHDIVSGELDADRLDYTVRDPLSSGMELGIIDIDRLIDSLQLFQDTKRKKLKVLPQSKNISSIDQFFHQRYLVYQYLIYHHNVVRMDLIIKEIVKELFYLSSQIEEKDDLAKNIRKTLEQSELFKVQENNKLAYPILNPQCFYKYDDYWLKTLFINISDTIKHYKKIHRSTIEKNSNFIPKNIQRLSLFIDTFLMRKTNNIYSLTKRTDDYFDIIDSLTKMKDIKALIKQFETNNKLEEVVASLEIATEIREDLEKLIEHYDPNKGYEKVVTSLVIDGEIKKDLFKKAINQLKYDIKKDVLLKNYNIEVLHRIVPHKLFKYNELRNGKKVSKLEFIKPENKLKPVSKASPYLESLATATMNTPNFNIFFICEDIKGIDVNSEIKKKILQYSKKHLKIYVKEYIGVESK